MDNHSWFKKYVNSLEKEEVNRAAVKITHEMSRAISEAISIFYADYDPIYYQRVFGLKNLFRVQFNNHTSKPKLVFDFSADYITGQHNSPDDVFESAFLRGWHGGEYAWGHKKTHIARTLPSPYEQVLKYLNVNLERMVK